LNSIVLSSYRTPQSCRRCSVSLQQTLNLPLSDNYTVNVQIRIQSHGREYHAYIQTDYSDWYSFPIHLKQDDLKELNKELQEMIEQASGSFEVERANVAECNERLQALAKKGSFAFKKIFDKGTPQDVLREALKEGAIIQITSEDFFIPWELLYDGLVESRYVVPPFLVKVSQSRTGQVILRLTTTLSEREALK
jgi:hypothetical protein